MPAVNADGEPSTSEPPFPLAEAQQDWLQGLLEQPKLHLWGHCLQSDPGQQLPQVINV